MTEPRFVRVALRIASGGVLVFLYLPIVVLAIYAFNESRIQFWPPTNLSLKWFFEAAATPAIVRAVGNSLIAASVPRISAIVVATLAALAVQRYDFFGKHTISFLLVLPIALPGVVTGKPAALGGSRTRSDATARGLAHVLFTVLDRAGLRDARALLATARSGRQAGGDPLGAQGRRHGAGGRPARHLGAGLGLSGATAAAKENREATWGPNTSTRNESLMKERTINKKNTLMRF